MGSLGTIGQSAKSDVDYWVIINRKEMRYQDLCALQEKANIIEEWAYNKRGLEVHFFLTDISKAQQNDFGTSDEESAGSAMSKLLKEEFYRTALLIQGQIPFWWLTPLGYSEKDYHWLLELNSRKQLVDPEDCLDLGYLEKISMQEFFGAALWQMAKFLKSPFKSLLKMALLAKYIDTESETNLLCDLLKERVFANPNASELADPYILMFDSVSEYYSDKGDWNSFQILQQSFYLKTGLKISQEATNRVQFEQKFNVMKNYILKWGWDAQLVNELDNINLWKLDKIQKFGDDIRDFMLDTYRELVNKAQDLGKGFLINKDDLTVLGRKLLAAFGKKKNKVEHLYTYFFHGDLSENHITVSLLEDSQSWALFREKSEKVEKGKGYLSPIYQSTDMLQLMVWTVYNSIYHPKTTISLLTTTQNSLNIKLDSLKFLLSRMRKIFLEYDSFKVDIEAFKNSAKREKTIILLNFDCRQEDELKQNDSSYLITEKWDILNYGAQDNNLIRNLGVIYINSWGELFNIRHHGLKGFLKCLENIIQLFLSGATPLSSIEVWSHSGRMASAAKLRTNNLIKELYSTFAPTSSQVNKHDYTNFLTQISGCYYFFSTKDGKKVNIQKIPNNRILAKKINTDIKNCTHLTIDSFCHSLKSLQNSLQENKTGQVQIFSSKTPTGYSVFILDEEGNILWEEVTTEFYQSYLRSICHFLSNYLQTLYGKGIKLHELLQYYEVENYDWTRRTYNLKDKTLSILDAINKDKDKRNRFPFKISGLASLATIVDLEIIIGKIKFRQRQLQDDFYPRIIAMLSHKFSRSNFITKVQVNSSLMIFVDLQSKQRIKPGAICHYKLKKQVEQELRAAYLKMMVNKQ